MNSGGGGVIGRFLRSAGPAVLLACVLWPGVARAQDDGPSAVDLRRQAEELNERAIELTEAWYDALAGGRTGADDRRVAAETAWFAAEEMWARYEDLEPERAAANDDRAMPPAAAALIGSPWPDVSADETADLDRLLDVVRGVDRATALAEADRAQEAVDACAELLGAAAGACERALVLTHAHRILPELLRIRLRDPVLPPPSPLEADAAADVLRGRDWPEVRRVARLAQVHMDGRVAEAVVDAFRRAQTGTEEQRAPEEVLARLSCAALVLCRTEDGRRDALEGMAVLTASGRADVAGRAARIVGASGSEAAGRVLWLAADREEGGADWNALGEALALQPRINIPVFAAQVARSKDADRRTAGVRVLGRCDHDLARAEILPWLDQGRPDWETQAGRRAAMDQEWAMVPVLIDALRTPNLRLNAYACLRRITEADPGDTHGVWARWWKDRTGR